MDNRPIGVFDSGLGGLTAVKALRRLLPGEDLIYFGDTARVPYGGRSRETLLKYARQDIAFLRSFDLKAVLIACGTVTSTSLDTFADNDLPVVGRGEPSCRDDLLCVRNLALSPLKDRLGVDTLRKENICLCWAFLPGGLAV